MPRMVELYEVVFAPVSEGACIVNFGRRLKAARPQPLLAEENKEAVEL